MYIGHSINSDKGELIYDKRREVCAYWGRYKIKKL
jgi:hypothetical protein